MEEVTKPLAANKKRYPVLLIAVVISLLLGTLSGYLLSTKTTSKSNQVTTKQPKTAQQDTRTFRDFAEGVIRPKPTPSDPSVYTEGTHYLERAGTVPVALTSSVVDLSIYEGKKVKVYGETQKAIKEGWLMDVGRVEESK